MFGSTFLPVCPVDYILQHNIETVKSIRLVNLTDRRGASILLGEVPDEEEEGTRDGTDGHRQLHVYPAGAIGGENLPAMRQNI